jgi:hypothetical protein
LHIDEGRAGAAEEKMKQNNPESLMNFVQELLSCLDEAETIIHDYVPGFTIWLEECQNLLERGRNFDERLCD